MPHTACWWLLWAARAPSAAGAKGADADIKSAQWAGELASMKVQAVHTLGCVYHAAHSTQHIAHSIQHKHAAYSIQHTAHNTQHAACSTQHTTHSMQHAAHSTQHTACSIARSLRDQPVHTALTVSLLAVRRFNCLRLQARRQSQLGRCGSER